jgi:hypothetical protein
MGKNTWVAVGTVIVVLVVVAYVAGRGSNNAAQTTSTPQTTAAAIVTATSSTQESTNTSASNNTNDATGDTIFSQQQACSQLLTDFQTRWENQIQQDSSTQYLEQTDPNHWQFSFQDFVIGYSPSLNACIGGFSIFSSSAVCEQQGFSNCNTTEWDIINVSTNQPIHPNPTSEAEFQAKLSTLTDGQI